MQRVVTAIGHIGLRVTDLEACVDHAEGVLGLRVVERTGDEAFLTCGGPHHALHLIRDQPACVDHIGLVAAEAEALELLASRLGEEGIAAQPGPGDHVDRSLVFHGPEGFTFEVYTGMAGVPFEYQTTGIRPRRLGHVNIRAADPGRMAGFLQRVLGFLVSDDLLDVRGTGVLWGPVRHGAGENIAVYHRDPSGAVVEHYTDMERIYDDGRARSGRWAADDPRWLSRWAPAVVFGELRDLGLPPRLAQGETSQR